LICFKSLILLSIEIIINNVHQNGYNIKHKLGNNNMASGNRLKQAQSNLSLRKFAQLLGVSLNTIVRYEKDERVPSVKFLKKIHDKLEIETEWLLYGRGPMYSSDVDKPDIAAPCSETALKRTIEAIETVMNEKELRPPPQKKAALIMMVYGEIVEGNFKDEQSINKMVYRLYKAIR
jgi:transcriptional regulator with XRE-family HTH domain